MDFEFNPFRLLIPPGGEPIRSITITSDIEWLDIPGPITGQEAFMPLNVRDDMPPFLVFSTGADTGQTHLRPLQSGHIPQLEISKINGLQAALNSLVKTITSGNPTALSITNNGVGDYLVTPNFGTIANKIAQGNDSRFPSNVTGLRKGAGLASLDVAAVAKTDYWDASVFGVSGASHAKGLVPDPGVTAGTTKFLCEDGLWKVSGAGTVTSVGLFMPSGTFTVTGSPVTTAGTLNASWVNVPPHYFLATFGADDDTPDTRPPVFRLMGFHDLAHLVGSDSGTICAGDDRRLPATVIGIRKGVTVGSLDVAATRFVDYWDNTVFGPKGPSHNIGLVPDPGSGSAPYVRFLRDDSTWQPITLQPGTVDNTSLATAPARTLKANATGSVASPADVTAKDARSSLLLNIESITMFGDADYTSLVTDRYVSTSATFTASRTLSLPLANTFNPGQQITIADDFGAIAGINILKVQRQGADLIQGSSTAFALDVPKGSVTLASNGTNKWSVVRRAPSVVQRFYISNATYVTPTGVKSLLVECLGGGGGGAGAVASASNASSGGGGASGGYARTQISSPSSSYAMTIGPGGAGGTSGSAGSDGTPTSFGSVCSGDFGGGGNAMTGGSTVAFSGGGVSNSGTGDFMVRGSDGGKGMRLSGTAGLSGAGMAPPVLGAVRQGTEIEAIGNSAFGYGSGGAGALSLSSTGKVGGSGSQGLIIVTEYY